MIARDCIGNELYQNDLVIVRLSNPDRVLGRIAQINAGVGENGIAEMIIAVPVTLQRRSDREVNFPELVKLSDPEKALALDEAMGEARRREAN